MRCATGDERACGEDDGRRRGESDATGESPSELRERMLRVGDEGDAATVREAGKSCDVLACRAVGLPRGDSNPCSRCDGDASNGTSPRCAELYARGELTALHAVGELILGGTKA